MRCARWGNADFSPPCWPALAEAEYALGRVGEAHQLTEEAEALAAADDLDAQVRWRATRAKVLAQRGQFTAARQLAGQAEALIAPTSWASRAPGCSTGGQGRGVQARRRTGRSRRQPAQSAAHLSGPARGGPRGPDPGRTGQPARRTGINHAGSGIARDLGALQEEARALKASAAAIFKMATPGKVPRSYGKH